MTANIVLRCDANAEIGGGHLMRTLTLANELTQRSFSCLLATRRSSLATLEGMNRDMPPLAILRNDGPDELKRAVTAGGALLLLDHYGLGVAFECEMTGWADRIAVIDDGTRRKHRCDVLIDHNVGHTPELYDGLVSAEALFLTGPRYALVRPEFATARRARTSAPSTNVKTITVLMGLTDPDNITELALGAVYPLTTGTDIQVQAILGNTAPHLKTVRNLADTSPRIELLESPPALASILSQTDLAISAAGSTAMELATLGIPMLLVEAAPNQATVAKEFSKVGAAVALGDWRSLSPETLRAATACLLEDQAERRRLSSAAASLCDGLGASRVADELTDLIGQ